jgi:hypothetical protein
VWIDPCTTSADETSAPTARYESVMVVLAAASFHNPLMGVFDVAAAFLNSTLKKKHFMRLSPEVAAILVQSHPEFAKYVRRDRSLLVQLDGGLYGVWSTLVRESIRILIPVWLHSVPLTHAFFTRLSEGTGSSCPLMWTMVSTSRQPNSSLMSGLERQFEKITHHQGDVLSFLGLRIEKTDDGVIYVSQPAYVESLLEDSTSAAAVTPATSNILKVAADSPPVDQKLYLSKVMKLMYLATKTRPDILCSVSFLASRSAKPTKFDMLNVERVYSYLRGTKDLRLRIRCDDMKFSASVDASFNIHREDAAGHTGMLFMISDSPIFFRSVKQKCQATSATHAEILAMGSHLHRLVPTAPS